MVRSKARAVAALGPVGPSSHRERPLASRWRAELPARQRARARPRWRLWPWFGERAELGSAWVSGLGWAREAFFSINTKTNDNARLSVVLITRHPVRFPRKMLAQSARLGCTAAMPASDSPAVLAFVPRSVPSWAIPRGPSRGRPRPRSGVIVESSRNPTLSRVKELGPRIS